MPWFNGEICLKFVHVIILFMSAIITVDIGGTQLRVALFSGLSITPKKVERCPTHEKPASVLDRLIGVIESLWPDEEVTAISVACPGPLDPATGIVISTPNIPEWTNFPLVDLLKNRFHVPVFIENDANLAALGEWRYGAGQGSNDLIYLTISTGIGGGVISAGRLLTGSHGLAAELGHITVLQNKNLCSCGQRGHLEAVSSGPAIARYVKKRISAGRRSSLTNDLNITARNVAAAARQGDALCSEAFEVAGRYLGYAVADMLHIFNPSLLIFGGGVSQSGDLLFTPMKQAIQERVMDPAYLDNLHIEIAKLGDDAGLLGALAYVRK